MYGRDCTAKKKICINFGMKNLMCTFIRKKTRQGGEVAGPETKVSKQNCVCRLSYIVQGCLKGRFLHGSDMKKVSLKRLSGR